MGTVCIQRDSWVDDLKMSVIFPNMDTQLGFWKTGETDCVSVPTDLSLFLAKYPDHRSATPEPQKIRVVWPAILSSDCSTWLSTRKAESDKKQTEKEKTKPNPWLVTREDLAANNLASSVKEGLIRAGSMETMESRVPLPISEEVSEIAENDEEVSEIAEKMEDEPQSLPAMVRMGLLRAGSVSLPPRTQPQDCKSSKPWAPKSLAEEVKIGLLKSARGFDKEIDSDESKVSDGPMESIADALRRSFMTISMNSETTSVGAKTASLENHPEESREESLDAWILDDGQSEGASIITLDTLTDSDDMEDFDDFKDIEDELSMWISKN